MWMSSNGHVMIYTDDAGVVVGPSVAMGQYHLLSMTLDTIARTTSFYVDGNLAGILSMGDPTGTTIHFTDAMYSVYDGPGYLPPITRPGSTTTEGIRAREPAKC